MCLLQENLFTSVLFFFSFWKFTELRNSPEELKYKYGTVSAQNSGLRKARLDDWFPQKSFFQIFLVVRHNKQSFYPASHTLVCSILFYSLFLKCLTHKISRSLRQHSTVWKTPTYSLSWKPRMCIEVTPHLHLASELRAITQVTLASTLAGQWPSFWQVGQFLLNDMYTTRTIKRPPVIQRFTQE